MSWLKPYLRTWYRAYPEGIAPVRQIAHYVKPLLKNHSEERITQELTAYLRVTLPRFISLPKFVATFGSWSRPEPQAHRPYSQTADEADRRAGIPIP